ncbi:MAG: hypothetical protein AMXMBFR8_12060 [Nevskiales bacterium]
MSWSFNVTGETGVGGSSHSTRILFITSGLRIGGAENILLRLVVALESRGYRCGVISLTGEGEIAGDFRRSQIGVSCVNLRKPWRIAWDVPHLLRTVRSFRPDLLQGWMYHGNIAAIAAGTAVSRRAPVVWGVRQCVYDLASENSSTRRVIRLSAKVSGRTAASVYPSRTSAMQHQKLGFRSRLSAIIPNGIDRHRLRPNPEIRTAVRGRLGLLPDHLVIGHVARFDPIKNHAGLVDAAAMLIVSIPMVRLVLVGPGVDNHNPVLLGWLEQHRIMDKVLLLGSRNDVPELMAAFDVFCLPSISEAFPNALAEAAACGLPCVATDVGEAAAIVGDDGLLVPVRDHDGLVSALRKALTWTASQRSSVGMRLRHRVTERFSAEAMTDAFDGLYQSVLAGHAFDPATHS